jgi:hypothetical protein
MRAFRRHAHIVAVAAVVMTSAGIAGQAGQIKSAVPAKPDDRAVVHVLNRLGFGAAPGDIERVRTIGLRPTSISTHPNGSMTAGWRRAWHHSRRCRRARRRWPRMVCSPQMVGRAATQIGRAGSRGDRFIDGAAEPGRAQRDDDAGTAEAAWNVRRSAS